MKVMLDHLASRWDRSPATLLSDIERSDRAGAHVISVTEVADGKRHVVLARKGWVTLHERRRGLGPAECAILVRESFGTVVGWDVEQIGPDLGPGNEVYAIAAVIKVVETGERLLVAECHLPSSVEDMWGERRGREYRKMARKYRAFIKRMRKQYKVKTSCVWADWNLNLNKAWVEQWARKALKGIGQLIASGKLPKQGTHGPRLIDWPVTRRLRKRTLVILEQTAASDHRGARLTATMSRT